MQKNTNFEEEIIFFDAEIAEDDGDEDIPMGTLVSAPEQENEPVEDVATDTEPEDLIEAEPAEESVNDDLEPAVESVTEPVENVEAPVEEPAKVETQPVVVEKKPAKPKTSTAPKKQVNETDIWGLAVINTKNPKKEAPAEEKVEEPKVEKKPAPKKKATAPSTEKQEPQKEAQKPAPKKAKAEPKKEEESPAKEETKTTKKNTTKKTSEEEPKVAVKAPEETIIQEGTREYHGKFVIKKTDKGHFVYKLFAYGGKVVAIGAQAYEGLSGVKGGIASVSKIAGIDTIIDLTKAPEGKLPCPRWEIFEDKKEEFRLRLIASNGNLVATTNDGYTTKAAAKKGIESVAKAADGAAIVRNDNAW